MVGSGKRNNRVVAMSKHGRGRRLAPLRLIEAYWQALSDLAGGVPRRDRIDPRGFQDALDNAFLCDRVAPGVVRFRIAGNLVSTVLARDAAGQPFSALVSAESRARIAAAVQSVFEMPAVLSAELEAAPSSGEPRLTGQLLLLPLLSDDGTTDRALGGIATVGPIGDAPRLFTVNSTVVRPLAEQAALRKRAPVSRAPAATTSAPPGLSEPPATYDTGRRSPKLQLIVSNTDRDGGDR